MFVQKQQGIPVLIIILLVAITSHKLFSQPSKQEDKFIACAANGDTDKIERFLKKGIDVNAKNKSRWTALAYACKYNHVELVKILIDNNADVNMQVNTGSSPLQIALNNGNMEIAEILLQNNADINLKDIMGMSALAWAAKQGDLKTVIFLIKHNADINSQNINSRTVLDIATSDNVRIYLKTKGAKTSSELVR